MTREHASHTIGMPYMGNQKFALDVFITILIWAFPIWGVLQGRFENTYDISLRRHLGLLLRCELILTILFLMGHRLIGWNAALFVPMSVMGLIASIWLSEVGRSSGAANDKRGADDERQDGD